MYTSRITYIRVIKMSYTRDFYFVRDVTPHTYVLSP